MIRKPSGWAGTMQFFTQTLHTIINAAQRVAKPRSKAIPPRNSVRKATAVLEARSELGKRDSMSVRLRAEGGHKLALLEGPLAAAQSAFVARW